MWLKKSSEPPRPMAVSPKRKTTWGWDQPCRLEVWWKTTHKKPRAASWSMVEVRIPRKKSSLYSSFA